MLVNYQFEWIPWSNWIACAHWMLDFCFVMSCSLVNSVLFSWTEFWKVGSTKEHDINSSDNIFMYNGSLSLAQKFVHKGLSGTNGRFKEPYLRCIIKQLLLFCGVGVIIAVKSSKMGTSIKYMPFRFDPLNNIIIRLSHSWKVSVIIGKIDDSDL